MLNLKVHNWEKLEDVEKSGDFGRSWEMLEKVWRFWETMGDVGRREEF